MNADPQPTTPTDPDDEQTGATNNGQSATTPVEGDDDTPGRAPGSPAA